FLPKSFPHERALVLSLDALTNMVAMRLAATEFDVAQQEACAKAQIISRVAGSIQIPFMGDVETRCKTFAQRADHAANALLHIVRLFYSDLQGKNWYDLVKLARALYGEDDN